MHLGRVEIYGLFDANGRCRYIGKANDSARRLATHFRDCRRRDTPVYKWIRESRPVMHVLCVVSSAHWPDVEREMIAQWRTVEPDLLNCADGGNEPKCSYETRAQNGRNVAKLRKATDYGAALYTLKRKFGKILRSKDCPDRYKQTARYAAAKRPDLFGCWATI